MKTIGRIAAAVALTMSSAAPVMAEAVTRPGIVSYAAPSADELGSVLGSHARSMAVTTKKQSHLFGGTGFIIALLTSLSGLLGYSSLQAFLADAQDGILGNSPK